jgi:hypothetical protein
MESFRIKTYGKSELALLYFPNCQTAEGALRCLNFWIKGNRQLLKELKDCGMPRTSKNYTPREVAVIVSYLGEP